MTEMSSSVIILDIQNYHFITLPPNFFLKKFLLSPYPDKFQPQNALTNFNRRAHGERGVFKFSPSPWWTP